MKNDLAICTNYAISYLNKNTYKMKRLMAAAIGLLLASCGNSPEINITSPSDGQTFTAGDILLIEGTITDDGVINSLSVSSEIELFFETDLNLSNVADRSSIVLEGIGVEVPTILQAGTDVITIRAVDDESNVTEESVTINVE